MNRNDLPIHIGQDQGTDLQSEQYRGGGAGGFRDSRGPELGVDWRRIKLALIRQLPLIVLITVLGTAAGFGLSRMIDPEYLAEARLVVRGPAGGGGGGAQGGPIETGALLQNTAWLDLMNSFEVLDRVAEDQKLFLGYLEPSDSIYFRDFSIRDDVVGGTLLIRVSEDGENYELIDVDADDEVIEEGRVGGRIGVYRGLFWQPTSLPAGHEMLFWVSSVREAAGGLRADLDSGMDARGSFIRVWLSGTNPVRVANTVNAVAQSLVDVADNQKRADLAERISRLETQLTDAQQSLALANGELESFLVSNVTVPTDPAALGAGGDPTVANFLQRRQQRDDLEQQIADIERAELTRGPDGGLVIDAFESIPAVQNSSQMMSLLRDLGVRRDSLRALRMIYNDEYIGVRDIIQQIDGLERTSIPGQIDLLVDVLETRVDELNSQLSSQTTELQSIPARTRQEQELRSAVARQSTLLDQIESAYQTAILAEATVSSDLSILDEATIPRAPVSNTTMQLLLMAVVGSLGLGVFGALFLDRIDNRIRYPDQITYDLGLNILGAVPRGRRRSSGKFKNSTEVLEAFRSLRLNLIHAHNQAGPLTLTLTSPDPGDGKSFVTSNLAWVFASLGQRTLVIDGDTRRGTLHRLLEVERKPGLTDYLSGRVSADELIVPSQKQNVHVIPSGARIGHSPELLSSNAMVRLVNDMRDRYQVILIDSPPLRAGVDPLALATITENLLIVLRSGVSDKEIVETKLQLLDQLPVRVLGAVLNNLAPRGHGYKQYSYLSDYGVDGEEATEAEILPPLPAR